MESVARPRPAQIEMGQKNLFPTTTGEGASPGMRQEQTPGQSANPMMDGRPALEENWWEFRFKGKQPDRRGYHSTFINDGV